MNGIQEVSGSIPLISTKENLETTMVSRFSFCPDQVAVLCSSNAFLTAKHAPLHFPVSSRQALPRCLSAPWSHLPVTTAIPPASHSTPPSTPTVPAASSPRGMGALSATIRWTPAETMCRGLPHRAQTDRPRQFLSADIHLHRPGLRAGDRRPAVSHRGCHLSGAGAGGAGFHHFAEAKRTRWRVTKRAAEQNSRKSSKMVACGCLILKSMVMGARPLTASFLRFPQCSHPSSERSCHSVRQSKGRA